MSRLRQKILEWIRITGNHSGCHQLSERSFFYKGKQFPVCARCTGVFFGQCGAFILAWVAEVPLFIAVFFLSIMGIDWLMQQLKILNSTNWYRLCTGIAGGFGLMSIYAFIVRKIISLFSL